MNAQLSVYISYFLLINLDIKVSAQDAFSGKTCINSGTFKPGSGGINRCGYLCLWDLKQLMLPTANVIYVRDLNQLMLSTSEGFKSANTTYV
jgi:hypothetical protein